MSTTPDRFRLHFVGASEDVPRLIRAYGRACDGEFGLVLRPVDKRGLLVLIQGSGAALWTSTRGEAPARPETAGSATSAVNQIRAAQDDLPREGPITLRGQWSGHLVCDEGRPRVMLHRNISSYAILHVESVPGEGWSYTVERRATWFTDHKDVRATRLGTLTDAIQLGVRAAMDLAAPACSYRDTRRRQAHDAAYAEKHPIKPAREQKDPTAQLKAKPEKAPKPEKPPKPEKAAKPEKPAKAAPPAQPGAQPPAPPSARRTRALRPVDAPVELPPPPRSAEALARATAQLQQAAAALPALAELGEQGMVELLEAEQRWLVEHDLDGATRPMRALAEDLRLQRWTEATALPNAIKQVSSAIDAHERGEDPPAAPVIAEARARVAALREALESRSPVLARARWLLRYADQAARSPRCRGPEQEEALAALAKAQDAYEAARKGFVEGRDAETVRASRKVAEPLLLAAAKIARTCKSGQTSLVHAGKRARPTPAPEPEAPRRGRPRKAEPTPAAEPAVDPELDARMFDEIEARLRKVLNV